MAQPLPLKAQRCSERAGYPQILSRRLNFFTIQSVSPGNRGFCLGSTTPCEAGDLCTDSGVCQNSLNWCADDDTCGGEDGSCMQGCKKIAFNIRGLRENLRQSIADLLQLTAMIKHNREHPAFANVDTHTMLYWGGSLGGVLGGPYMALEPDVAVGVLGVPGGGLANMLDSPLSTLVSELSLGNLFHISPADACMVLAPMVRACRSRRRWRPAAFSAAPGRRARQLDV
jgi:hypothetical protein